MVAILPVKKQLKNMGPARSGETLRDLNDIPGPVTTAHATLLPPLAQRTQRSDACRISISPPGSCLARSPVAGCSPQAVLHGKGLLG